MSLSDSIRIGCVAVLLFIEGVRDVNKKEVGLLIPAINAIAAVVMYFVFKDMSIGVLLMGLAEGMAIMVLSRLTGESVGFGDGVILCSTGMMLGWRYNLCMFFSACLICAVFGAILMMFKKADKKTRIPFVPFLIPGFILTVITGYLS